MKNLQEVYGEPKGKSMSHLLLTDTLRAVFIRAGKALHGDDWQAPLAAQLGVSDAELKGWLDEPIKIPTSAWDSINAKLEQRQRS